MHNSHMFLSFSLALKKLLTRIYSYLTNQLKKNRGFPADFFTHLDKNVERKTAFFNFGFAGQCRNFGFG
jgi:hypothetical protein